MLRRNREIARRFVVLTMLYPIRINAVNKFANLDVTNVCVVIMI